jgi:hypothetical protein
LQLVGNRFGDLALNGEHIRQIAIIGLSPNVCIVTGVDQLRDYPHTIGGTLHAAFQ